jgi:hypothetical protein
MIIENPWVCQYTNSLRTCTNIWSEENSIFQNLSCLKFQIIKYDHNQKPVFGLKLVEITGTNFCVEDGKMPIFQNWTPQYRPFLSCETIYVFWFRAKTAQEEERFYLQVQVLHMCQFLSSFNTCRLSWKQKGGGTHSASLFQYQGHNFTCFGVHSSAVFFMSQVHHMGKLPAYQPPPPPLYSEGGTGYVNIKFNSTESDRQIWNPLLKWHSLSFTNDGLPWYLPALFLPDSLTIVVFRNCVRNTPEIWSELASGTELGYRSWSPIIPLRRTKEANIWTSATFRCK